MSRALTEQQRATVADIPAGVCYREGPITNADYNEAIEDLLRAKRQDECRHICCSVCEDTGHTAEMCHHNPLILARKWAAATKVWACYHCGYVATNDEEARAHFGANDQPAACLADMLAALKRLYDVSGKSRDISDARRQAEEAIAKAEGGSS